MTDELVFVVPRPSIPDDAGWYGVRTDDLDAFLDALERDGRYEPRPVMEVDPSFKQVIPYLVLRAMPGGSLADRLEAGVARFRGEQQQEMLNGEISHRLKNMLSMVQAIASQTLRDVPDRRPVETFEQRLMALSAAHDVLLQKSWINADLRTVADAGIDTVGFGDRVHMAGPPVALGARAAWARWSEFVPRRPLPSGAVAVLILLALAASRGVTPRQVALAFLTRHPACFAIPKAASVRHTEENAAAFGYAGVGADRSAFPKVRVVSVSECASHAVVDAEMGPVAGKGAGEQSLARRLYRRLDEDWLLIADRNFYSYQAWRDAVATGAQLLWRG